MAKAKAKPTVYGLEVEIKKDFYLGLWNIHYVTGGKYAGPYKTKKEAMERLAEFIDTEAA